MGSEDGPGSVRAVERRKRPLFRELLRWKRTAWWILTGLCALVAGWFAVTRNWTGALFMALLAIVCAAVALVVQTLIGTPSRRDADDG